MSLTTLNAKQDSQLRTRLSGVISNSLFQLIMAVFVILINFFFLLLIITNKILRQLQFFPIALQAVIDIMSSGPPSFLLSLVYLQQHGFISLEIVENLHLSWLIRKDEPLRNWGWCVVEFLRLNFNEVGTALCILVLSVERFILVVTPFRAQTLLIRRNRIIIYVRNQKQ